MLGSRKMAGATIMPATAPTRAASPQPSASIQDTRMPQRRLEAGFWAAARMASPSVVKRKKTQMRKSMIKVTPMAPRSCGPKTMRPSLIGALAKGLGKGWMI